MPPGSCRFPIFARQDKNRLDNKTGQDIFFFVLSCLVWSCLVLSLSCHCLFLSCHVPDLLLPCWCLLQYQLFNVENPGLYRCGHCKKLDPVLKDTAKKVYLWSSALVFAFLSWPFGLCLFFVVLVLDLDPWSWSIFVRLCSLVFVFKCTGYFCL
jgi:hypothetical protein